MYGLNVYIYTYIYIYIYVCVCVFFVFVFFFFFAFLGLYLQYIHGSSQARGPIGATAASLGHSHSNAGSEPHLLPKPQLMALPHP